MATASSDPTTPDATVDDVPGTLAPLRVPATLDELAARKADALAIIQARIDIIAMVRLNALRRGLHPHDCVLFKSPDGLVTAFVEDAGCDRVRPFYGIE